MRERPILFSDEMVRAILSGQKTQTRRIVKNTQGYTFKGMGGHIARFGHADSILYVARHCPHGIPGDRLWVRESIRRKYLTDQVRDGATYLADLTPVMERNSRGEMARSLVTWVWKRDVLSARFMPRWASRITLEIANVRVERLQDITFDDAIAEGVFVDFDPPDGHGFRSEARRLYVGIWDRINANRGYGWDTNPWVWVIEFRVMEG